MSRQYIKLIVTTDEGRSESTIKGSSITPLMLEAAGDLTFVLAMGRRRTAAETKVYKKMLKAKTEER